MAGGWSPPSASSSSSSASAGPANPSATLHQVACFGKLQDTANSNVREAAQILHCLNPPLRKEVCWRALLWRSRRHWSVVLRPALGPDGCAVRADGDLLRGDGGSVDRAICAVPSNCFYLVWELLVASHHRDFFLRLSVYPDFDAQRDNVLDLGFCGPLALREISERAIGVISHYRAYGLIGCNCQHYALDLFHDLGVKAPPAVPDDQWAEEAAARGFQAYSLGMGIAKGVGASVGVATTGVGAAGALLLSAHVAAGVAVGFAGGVAMQSGYQWLCRLHRREEQDEPHDAATSQQEQPQPSTFASPDVDSSAGKGIPVVQPRRDEGLLYDWGKLA
eukprot:CAMPEP_0204572552 /NCGR_PEP_ID=MMETSP0661-20131031/39529_1 /ASSEMBLY_ACC=CAM_ASM_000606 /TAXON_ID=109239 /ORGANISM="Alexandrium margalefi, Strain AMGDE01CS-322" /LENGTH=334 /DNA_ID=CAMNT_0051580915 /DNA_START=46 /DNA_END=1050 /DNA_ORIENTATION=-